MSSTFLNYFFKYLLIINPFHIFYIYYNKSFIDCQALFQLFCKNFFAVCPLLIVKGFSHWLVLTHTKCKNFFFNHYIFKPCMRFHKIFIATDISVNDFCGKSQPTIFCQIVVFLTKSAVCWHCADYLPSHFQSVANFHSVREKISVFWFCQPPLRVV